MKRIALVFATICLASFAQANEVTIGMIMPLGGNNAYMGELAREAVNYWQGTLEGRELQHSYKVVFEDDQMTPRMSVSAARKLIDLDQAQALITLSGGPSGAVAPITQAKGVILFAQTNLEKAAVGSYNFTNYTPAIEQAKASISLMKAMGTKNVGFLNMRHNGVQLLMDKLDPLMAEAGIGYFEETFNPGERDFRLILSKLDSQKPDLLYIMAFPPEIEIIYNQLHQTELSDAVTTTAVTIDFMQDKSAVEGVYYASGAAPIPSLVEDYTAKTGNYPSFVAPSYIDSLNMLVEAFELTPDADTKATVEHLNAIETYEGVQGTLTQLPDGIFSTPGSIYQVRNGTPVKVDLDEIPTLQN